MQFIQFLIVWEENLREDIHWYLARIGGPWQPTMLVSLGLGFFVPLFALLTAPAKRSHGVVGGVCLLILLGQLAQSWWLVLPAQGRGIGWIDVAVMLAFGGVSTALVVRRPGRRLGITHA